jgi:hypothetical protein
VRRACLEPLQLRRGEWSRTLPQRDDGGTALRERCHAMNFVTSSLTIDSARSTSAPPREVLLDDALQVVDVVEEHLLDLADGGIDVARDGDVDDEERVLRRCPCAASSWARVMIGRCDPVAVMTMSASRARSSWHPRGRQARRRRARVSRRAPASGS